MTTRAIGPIGSLLLGVAILLAGQGLQGVLLPVRATLEAFSAQAVGFIGGTYFLGFTVGCWFGARLIRRAGHVRVFAAMTAVASAMPLLLGLWVNLWSWGVLRFVTGFCFAVLYVAIESWMNEQATDENRGKVFGLYIFIHMTLLAVGQQMLLLDDPEGLALFALASVLVSLAAVPVLMFTSEQPRQPPDSPFDLPALYRNSPSGMLGSLSSGLTNGAFWSLAPVFIAAVTDETDMAAWFMTAGVLGGAAGQWPFGWLSDRIDRRRVLAGLGVGGALVGFWLAWQGGHMAMPSLLLLGFLWGAAAFPVYSIAVAQANDRADPNSFVLISSGLLLMYGMGAVVGPLVAPLLMRLTGDTGMFLFTAAVHGGLAVYVATRSVRKVQPPAVEQTDFSDALTSVLTASRIYEEEIETEETTAPSGPA